MQPHTEGTDMNIRTFIIFIVFIFSCINVVSSVEFDIVRPDNAYQDCVSLTIKYCNDNPEYMPCTISNNRLFRGLSHMVAIKIIDNETIMVHDELNNAHYESHNWFLDGQYYHFWIDEPLKRNYKYLLDNREMVLYC